MRRVVVGAVVAIGLAGCGGSPNDQRITSKTLTLYAGLPLRGEQADAGRAALRGMKLALQEADGKAGRFSISLAALDDTDTKTGRWAPGQVAANARRAAQNPTVIGYIGDIASGATAVSLPITNELGILQVSPLSGYPGLTEATDKGEPDKYYPSGRRTFARIVPSGDVEAHGLASWLHELGYDKVALAYDGLQDGLGQGRDVEEALREAGIDLVEIVRVNPRASDPGDVDSQARDLARAPARAVLYAGGSTKAALALLRAVHERSPDKQLFATDGVAGTTLAQGLGPAESETRVASPLIGVAHRPPAARRMASRYAEAFGEPPPPAALFGYEAMRSVLAAIRRAGPRGNDRRDVVESYLATRAPSSVLGPYAIRSGGDTTSTTYGGFDVRGGRLRFDRLLLQTAR
jgi:branched-chain amino acid transport system substrate-binding protein